MIDVPHPYSARFGSTEDIEAIWRLMVTVNEAEAGTPGFALAEVENWLTGDYVTLERDLLVVEDSATGIVAAEFVDQRPPYVRPFAVGGVHPVHVGRGVGSAMIAWAFQHAAAGSIAQAPPEARLTFLTHTAADHEPSIRLMRSAGLDMARNFLEMKIDFEEAPAPPVVPEGIVIRPFEPESELAELAQAVADGFRDHYGHVEVPLEQRIERLRHWMKAADHDPGLWWVADAAGRIVGYNLSDGANEGDDSVGYVASLAVLPEFRGRGLGEALLMHSFNEFYARGKIGAALGVDAESLTGATRLYERVGMVVGARYALWEAEIRPGVELATTDVATSP